MDKATMEKNKNQFKKWCKKYITTEKNAPKVEPFLEWLETTDFFTTPASTKFHSNVDGGLCQHTLNVIKRLFAVVSNEYPENQLTPEFREEVFLAAAMHDLCKINFYKKTTRNKKNNETGKWEEIPFWEIENDFPMGHGEKSLFLTQKFFDVTDDVALAIRWHMGFSDVASKGGSYDIGATFNKSKLALCLYIADNMASFWDEETVKY